ncbi:DUF695 domain-containing protein [Kutzneria sp. NPDC051319]|uniref:DUF695 domain-containing protein n=1 Tax=Kutzneria sp. NPDC051319 TaxID=3155047 RepID=UPI0034175FA1
MQFWAWWAEHAADPHETLIEELSAQVTAIHPGLQWEIGPGATARHVLCLSGAGDPTLRAVAERWAQSAPTADETWEFTPTRRPDANALTMRLTIDKWDFDLSKTVVSIRLDEASMWVDVDVHHPLFDSVPGAVRKQIATLVVAWALGEDGRARWVDRIGVAVRRPEDALPVEALPETVAALAERQTENNWAILRGETESGAPVMAVAMRPMRWVDHPSFDRHLSVDLSFRGVLDDPKLMSLRALEDEIVAALAGNRVLMVGHETVKGRRTLHFYCDSTDEGPADIIRRWVRGRWGRKLRVDFDPGWTAVEHLR